MKYLLLTLLLLTSGCVGNGMNRKVYREDKTLKSELKVGNLGGMVNLETQEFSLTIKDHNDGDFELILKLKGRKQEDSPESARALGDAGANIISGGASGTIKEALK